jgi:membrane-associated phospholipid phosphatase
MTAATSNQALPWTAEIALRMRRLFLLKLVGTTAFTCIFFVAYFHLLRHPTQPPITMPLTALDLLIPFQPYTLFAYLSLWFYIGVAPGLQRNFAELVVFGLWEAALCVTGLAVFYVFPTAVPALTFDVSGFPGFAMLQGVDAAGNAFPSMHVAVSIFTAVHVEDVLRRARVPWAFRLVNVLWFLAIAWSTVAVRQHVVLDVIGGAMLGMAFALPSLRWRPRSDAPMARADPLPTSPTSNNTKFTSP